MADLAADLCGLSTGARPFQCCTPGHTIRYDGAGKHPGHSDHSHYPAAWCNWNPDIHRINHRDLWHRQVICYRSEYTAHLTPGRFHIEHSENLVEPDHDAHRGFQGSSPPPETGKDQIADRLIGKAVEDSMNWKTQTVLIGTAIGAVTGGLAALILIKRAEQNQTEPRITASDGVKIGMGAMGLVRMVSDLGSKKNLPSG